MAETGKIEIGTSTLNMTPTFSNATKTSGDYNSLENLPTLNGAAIKGDKTNGELGIDTLITSESYTTVNTYSVPALTVDQVTELYNSFVAGKHTVVADKDGNQHFAVNQADIISDEICISVLYYNIMLLCYRIENDAVVIDYTEIGEI